MENSGKNQPTLLLSTHKEVSRKTPIEICILKDKKLKILTIQGTTTLISSRESIKFSIIKFYNKVITIQRTPNKNRI